MYNFTAREYGLLVACFILAFILCSDSHAMSTSYCHPNGQNQTVCTTYHEDGSSKSDYWTNNQDGSSYKSSSFGGNENE